jgi:hypothetical protein
MILFLQIFREPLIKGIELETQSHELGIKTGGMLTIFGDIIYNLDNNSLRIDNPLIFMCNKMGLINHFYDAQAI